RLDGILDAQVGAAPYEVEGGETGDDGGKARRAGTRSGIVHGRFSNQAGGEAGGEAVIVVNWTPGEQIRFGKERGGAANGRPAATMTCSCLGAWQRRTIRRLSSFG